MTSYALVNGRRTVYMPVTKRADASTLSVVELVKKSLPKFQGVVPDDIKVSYEFDQSPVVTHSIKDLVKEGAIGAVLTGLMVLLFLRDWRSAFIVVINIPLSLLAASFALWISGQSINLMTLGGLALAVGILVASLGIVWIVGRKLGTEIFPTVDSGQLALRLRAPTGTRIENSEQVALKALDLIKREVGADNVALSIGLVGVHAPSYPVNLIYLCNGGPEESYFQVQI